MRIFKSPERVLCRSLVCDPVVAGLVGFRVFPILAPSSAAVPFIVYERTTIERNPTLGSLASVGVPRLTVQFSIYGVTYSDCREIADAVRLALDGKARTSYGTEVKRAFLENESDGIAQLEGGELPPVYQVTQSYDILWQEL
jgi:hypothetical protein